MLAADQFGDRVDFIGGERDDRGASRLARDLAVAGEFELRQSGPRHDRRARQQPLDDGAHRRSPQQQRLVAAAAVQDAIGEDMPAFEIGRDLDFIDREERDVDIARHRLDGGHPVARVLRLDLLLAGDQRDALGAGAIGDLVVDLARQQPQRQADDPGRMPQHPLDRQMGLAGVGRPQHRGNAGAGSPFMTERGRVGESHILQVFLLFSPSLRAQRSNPSRYLRKYGLLRRFAPRNDENRRFVCQFATVMRSRLKLWNELRTNRARIADSH